MSKHRREQYKHFEEPLDMQLMEEDFDFEANLALFDKIPSTSHLNKLNNGTMLGVQVEEVTFKTYGAIKKFRHDQNVLQNPEDIYVNPSKTIWFKDGKDFKLLIMCFWAVKTNSVKIFIF